MRGSVVRTIPRWATLDRDFSLAIDQGQREESRPGGIDLWRVIWTPGTLEWRRILDDCRGVSDCLDGGVFRNRSSLEAWEGAK